MRNHSAVRNICLVLAVLCLSVPAQASGLSHQKQSPLFNKGELFTRTTSGDVALGPGTTGQVLSIDPTTATGLRWGSIGASGGGAGTVTNSGALTSNAVIIGQGTTVIAAITADSATSGHFLASTAGAPAFRKIISPDISGVFSETSGGTGFNTYAKGDLIGGIGTNTLGKLPIGSMGQILSVDNGAVTGFKWVASPSSGGTPGSPVNSLQFNSAGSFAGAALISTDGTRVSIGPGTSILVSLDVAGNFRTVPFQLTDAASITLDCSRSNRFLVILGGNRTLANFTNAVSGQSIILCVSQDATGSRKMGFGTAYKFGTDVPSYDSSTIAGTKDYIGMLFMSSASADIVSVSKGYR